MNDTMTRDVPVGQADLTVLVKILGTDDAPETGLTYSDISISTVRVETDNDVVSTDVTPVTLSTLTDDHTDWGFLEVDATKHPGLYRLDVADSLFAIGATEAAATLTDASGTDFYATDLRFILTSTGEGVGAFPVELIIKLSNDTVVAEADVILTTTSTNINTNVTASGRCDANGSITFNLDAGTYYVYRQKAGINFGSTPATLTVEEDGSYSVA